MTGERRGREYRLGDRVRVVVLKASVEDRKIDFRLVEGDAGARNALPERESRPSARAEVLALRNYVRETHALDPGGVEGEGGDAAVGGAV